MASLDRRAADSLEIGGVRIDYFVRESSSASKLRIRVDSAGVEVVKPRARSLHDVRGFLAQNVEWVVDQLDRVSGSSLDQDVDGFMLFGKPASLRVEPPTRPGLNRIELGSDDVLLVTDSRDPNQLAGLLERRLRREARHAIGAAILRRSAQLKVAPQKIFIMDQKTKWASCSRLGNLSFNWRVVMGPTHVLEYLVAHELLHLAIPNHSQEFWLALQSIFPDADAARTWLRVNSERLRTDLKEYFAERTK
jgi:predicted metal-dependent hydrolase